MEAEKWKAIKGYEGYYEVSDLGRVKSLPRVWITTERFGVRQKGVTYLKPGYSTKENGVYLKVTFCIDRVKTYHSVHRLVAEAFCEKPEGCEVVNHLNANPSDCRAANLEWTTTQGNVRHSFNIGNKKGYPGEQNINAVLKEADVINIKSVCSVQRKRIPEFAKQFNVTPHTIRRILTGERWGHVK